MPKRIADDDDTPRRRRGAKAMVVEADTERGLVMRILLHSPKDLVAGALAVAAIGAIVANALFLQSGPHPSPMFGSVVTLLRRRIRIARVFDRVFRIDAPVPGV